MNTAVIVLASGSAGFVIGVAVCYAISLGHIAREQ